MNPFPYFPKPSIRGVIMMNIGNRQIIPDNYLKIFMAEGIRKSQGVIKHSENDRSYETPPIETRNSLSFLHPIQSHRYPHGIPYRETEGIPDHSFGPLGGVGGITNQFSRSNLATGIIGYLATLFIKFPPPRQTPGKIKFWETELPLNYRSH